MKRNAGTKKLEKYYHLVGWGVPCIGTARLDPPLAVLTFTVILLCSRASLVIFTTKYNLPILLCYPIMLMSHMINLSRPYRRIFVPIRPDSPCERRLLHSSVYLHFHDFLFAWIHPRLHQQRPLFLRGI